MTKLNLLASIGKALRTFFKLDLKVRREDGALRLVLEDKVPSSEPPTRKRKRKQRLDAREQREAREFERMRMSLSALLDEMSENRQVLRHLAFIERALQKKGLRALYKVPYDVLKHALTQLEGVVVNWSDEGLACLRSKMAVAVIDRERDDSEAEPAPRSAASVSAVDTVLLAHPVTLEGDEAAEAEAALRAAYGAVALPGLEGAAPPPAADPRDERPSQFEVQGELSSPSGRALAKAAKALPKEAVDLRLRELQH